MLIFNLFPLLQANVLMLILLGLEEMRALMLLSIVKAYAAQVKVIYILVQVLRYTS